MNEPIRLIIKEEKAVDSGSVFGIHVSEKIPPSMLDKIRLIHGINWIFQENFDLYYVKINISRLFVIEDVRKKIIDAILFSYGHGRAVLDITNQADIKEYEAIGVDDRDASYYAHSEDHDK